MELKSRRQFLAATGTLLGTVVVGESTMAKAHAAEAGKGSDVRKPAQGHAGTQLGRIAGHGIQLWRSCANGIRHGPKPA